MLITSPSLAFDFQRDAGDSPNTGHQNDLYVPRTYTIIHVA